MSEVMMKGQWFTSALQVLRGAATPQQLEQIFDLCPTAGPMFRRKEIVSSGWYPLPPYVEFHQAMVKVLGPLIIERVAREGTTNDVNQMFRFVLKLFSTDSVASMGPRIFGTYCKVAHVVVLNKSPGRIESEIRDFHGCIATIFEEAIVTSATFVSLGSGKDVGWKVLDGGKTGDSHCRFELTWPV